MKNSVWLLLVFLFVSTSSIVAQELLDTVFVSRKKKIELFTKVRYYYYPNLEAYFDTQSALYIYKKNGVWITSEHISPNYKGYCLYNNTFVIIKGYTDDEPYCLINEHKKEYPANFSNKRRKNIVVAQN
jgi:hypothetical protein